ncbi:hypothetical protein VPH35_076730 [Triticum aestivum]|uniref:Uncharacterized protein n=1 Tax=Aegilops tauschii subsp. strangulata TaxID=200361 RepID=A0A453HC73_AEGTS
MWGGRDTIRLLYVRLETDQHEEKEKIEDEEAAGENICSCAMRRYNGSAGRGRMSVGSGIFLRGKRKAVGLLLLETEALMTVTLRITIEAVRFCLRMYSRKLLTWLVG